MSIVIRTLINRLINRVEASANDIRKLSWRKYMADKLFLKADSAKRKSEAILFKLFPMPVHHSI
ncbi:hypothetical protein NZD88_16485 [Chryseobacterium antibioticum]|uniref:Transposase n=1 Tax=Chryseobacterium pyrolae TaxID=2987481 RepID=A0ABT2IKI0_9FLAO|nr:hypothetical protein [Chryseobacterium pyrolae]MCT2409146.1 hypothetical protein [Chryseobacterium pyrolae]